MEQQSHYIHPEGINEDISLYLIKNYEDIHNRIYNAEDCPIKKVKIGDMEGKIPRLDQMVWFQNDVDSMTQELKEKLDGNSFEQAYFLYQHALLFNFSFQASLQALFENVDYRLYGNQKGNLRRIAQKIQESDQQYKTNGMFRIHDMIRATIVVKHSQ